VCGEVITGFLPFSPHGNYLQTFAVSYYEAPSLRRDWVSNSCIQMLLGRMPSSLLVTANIVLS
jgi:hypothetical protein